MGGRCSSGGATRVVVPGAHCAPLDGVALVFNVPVAAQALRDALKISPDPRVKTNTGGDDPSSADEDESEADGDDVAGSRAFSGGHSKDNTYDVRLPFTLAAETEDRKSTRLNSSH